MHTSMVGVVFHLLAVKILQNSLRTDSWCLMLPSLAHFQSTPWLKTSDVERLHTSGRDDRDEASRRYNVGDNNRESKGIEASSTSSTV